MTARRRLPWFQFYAEDWMIDEKVRAMDFAEKGAYITLLCHQWIEGSIPADINLLQRCLASASSTGLAEEKLRAVLMLCFADHPTTQGRLVNSRLFEIQEAQRLNTRSKSIAGRRGGISSGNARRERRDSDIEEEDGVLDLGINVSQDKTETKQNLSVLPARRGNSLKAVSEHFEASVAAARGRIQRRDARRLAAELFFQHWCVKLHHPTALYDPKRERVLVNALRANHDDGSKMLWVIEGAYADDWAREELGRHDITVLFRDQPHIEKFLDKAPSGYKRGEKHPLWVVFVDSLRNGEPIDGGEVAPE